MTVGCSGVGIKGPKIPPDEATDARVKRVEAPIAPIRKARLEMTGPLAGEAFWGCV